ncbi:MAG: MalY/PatB family protein [Treponema sp.]
MKYDFESLVDRRKTSSKWHNMLDYNPNIPNDVIPLSTADMEFKNPPEVINAIKEYVDSTILGYSYMNEDFVKAFTNWMKRRHNYEVLGSSLVCTSGVVTSIFTAVKTFTKKGDGVVIMPPVYGPFYFAVNRTERTLIECNLINNNGYYTIDFEKLEGIFKAGKAKAIIFCSPHNPVGRVWKKDELKHLSDLCLKYDIFIIADEIHHDIIMQGHTHTVLETVDERLKEKIITCTSLSKTFNLAGLGLSISIIPDGKNREKFSEELEKIPSHINLGLSYKAYEVAYNECELWLNEALEVISNNLKLAVSYIKENIPSLKAYYPEGTYLLWIDFSNLKLSDEKLESFLKDSSHLFLTQGYVFGAEKGKGFARMNVAAPKIVIEKALERLKIAIKKLD